MEGDVILCLKKFKDGEKVCSSNKDCKGICLAENPEDTSGKCSKNNLYVGDLCVFYEEGKPPVCTHRAPFE